MASYPLAGNPGRFKKERPFRLLKPGSEKRGFPAIRQENLRLRYCGPLDILYP